jgi:hypothetical protein
MAETFVAGADFSGAKNVPNDTWLAVGNLTNLGLEIISLTNCGAHKLALELKSIHNLVAAGLDFPFSLPYEFLNFLSEKISRGNFQSWQEVAEVLAFMPFDKFLELVTEFKEEPKRIADKATNRAGVSPLHRANPSMVQMTYQGIRMLTSLDPKKFYVIPFQDEIPFGCAVMEAYPRETLFSLGLPDTGYKGKDASKSLETRKLILKGLVSLRDKGAAGVEHCPRISMNKNIEKVAIETDHALDAVIACYSVAIWKVAPQLFKDPYSSDDSNVLLEGWIYAPSLLRTKVGSST